MKSVKAFHELIRALHKSGKLNDAVSRKLTVTIARLQRDFHNGDRRNADKHFRVLCEILSDVLVG